MHAVNVYPTEYRFGEQGGVYGAAAKPLVKELPPGVAVRGLGISDRSEVRGVRVEVPGVRRALRLIEGAPVVLPATSSEIHQLTLTPLDVHDGALEILVAEDCHELDALPREARTFASACRAFDVEQEATFYFERPRYVKGSYVPASTVDVVVAVEASQSDNGRDLLIQGLKRQVTAAGDALVTIDASIASTVAIPVGITWLTGVARNTDVLKLAFSGLLKLSGRIHLEWRAA